jgi:hypothetical protein
LRDAENGIHADPAKIHSTPGTFVDFIEYSAGTTTARPDAAGIQSRTLREKLFGAGQYLPDRHVGRSYRYWDLQRASRVTTSKEKDVIV